VLNRLGKVSPIGAAAVGFALVLANPKVLLMNAAAGLIIGTAAVGLGLWLYSGIYTVAAGSSVIIPIVAYLVAGERVDPQLERLKDWVQREHAALTAAVLLIIGVLLTYTGIRAL
jgi:threonine/homoserine/homoserine lactone efflux protein